ncbi:MAG: hypothetical protein MOB07_15680 [Acidobacteria bacterium]|nr:hypothetical protein [Acidobacteriota bacterium]
MAGFEFFQSFSAAGENARWRFAEFFTTNIRNRHTRRPGKTGINQGYHLDLQANRITYDGTVKAAAQVRDAAIEAARLRALASVVSAVGHNIARDMEQGLILRY